MSSMTSEEKASAAQHLTEGLPVMTPVPEFGSLNFDGEKLQCHICRSWFRGLASHLRHGHNGLTAQEYKAEFGLNRTTPLISPDISRKLHNGILKYFAYRKPHWLKTWDKQTRPGGGTQWKIREEGCRRQQILQKGRLPPNTGKPCPLEQREKISKSLKGRPNPRKGQPLWSAEQRQEISRRVRDRALSLKLQRKIEARRKISQALKGKKRNMTPKALAAQRANWLKTRKEIACEGCGQRILTSWQGRWCSACRKKAKADYNRAYRLVHLEQLRQYFHEYDMKRRPPKRPVLRRKR